MKVQDRTVSDMTVSLRTRFLISSLRGNTKLAASSLKAPTLNLKMFWRSVDSNCFLALKWTSQGSPTSDDLTVVAYSCMRAVMMEQPMSCIWALPPVMSCWTSAITTPLSSPPSSTDLLLTMMAITWTQGDL